jgi:hypothetical protein
MPGLLFQMRYSLRGTSYRLNHMGFSPEVTAYSSSSVDHP